MIPRETIEAVDVFITKCKAAANDVALRQYFAETPPFSLPVCHLDPLTPAYKDFIAHVYEELADSQYSTTNEYIRVTPSNERMAKSIDFKYKRPFPFSTSTPATTSNHLRSISDIISHLPYNPGARILELGPGDGFLGECLLRMGYDVSFLELNPAAHRTLELRCKNFGRGKAICDEFNTVDAHFSEKFDVIIFYESFHHSFEFPELISKVKRLLTKNGILILAGEPIIKNWHQPWGIRNDSETLWAVRKHGWMELGFDEDFLLELFYDKGFFARVAPSNLAPIYIFSHRENGLPPDAQLPSKMQPTPNTEPTETPSPRIPSWRKILGSLKRHAVSFLHRP
ncbi:MAG: class I SAM-dependent methyltransferase [Desulfovibrio sp.]|uniref:class I SAM-dependent methyltransferase n=1 Tax=Desulfovibrio sp. TaxID=885 RepID=UPI001A67DB75|nr:class I SAM-dependent methyltransferase [Desulfovibrio sp.]MBD5416129.1 class I SAM-dependent methyltransferase [Desulfovibrio sp.]